MAETKEQPFWASDSERKDLNEATSGGPEVSAAVLQSAIPTLTRVLRKNVLCDYGIKDGYLIYHVYKADRKEVFDQAMNILVSVKDTKQQIQVAEAGNAQLESIPWWPNTEEVLRKTFSEHFRTDQIKVDFFPEVDSWSILMMEPPLPGAKEKGFLESAISKLALQFPG
jgi:hypothetical protein